MTNTDGALMDTSKMRDTSREQFEAWYLEKHCGGIDRVKTCSNAPDTYYYTDTQTKWVAWQASREAVAVELPDRDIEQCAYSLGFNSCLKQSREAIEAQGVKCK